MSESELNDSSEQPLSRRARRAVRGDTGKRLNAIPFLIAAVVVVVLTIVLLWWFLMREPAAEEEPWVWNDEPGLDGLHAHQVPSEDWETGWCLRDYEDEATPADVADCDRGYDAQVLLRRNISDGPYPGDETVIDTAHQWCHDELELDSAAVDSADYELQIQLWHPTESTWRRDYDRMVSCFLTRADGGQLTGSFLPDSEDDETPSPDDEGAGVEVVEEPRDTEDSDEGEDEPAEESD